MKNEKTTYELLEDLVHACMNNYPLEYYIWDGDLPDASDRKKALSEAAKLVQKWKLQDELSNKG